MTKERPFSVKQEVIFRAYGVEVSVIEFPDESSKIAQEARYAK